MNKTVNIKIFFAPNCNRCQKAVALVDRVTATLDNLSFEIEKLNVIDNIDQAVAFGIRATPAIVINDDLAFTATPTEAALKQRILQTK